MSKEEKKVTDVIPEDKNPGKEGNPDWDKEEKKTYTSEEVEEMKKKISSDHEKGVQKTIHQKKVLEVALDSLDAIAYEPAKLVELHSTNAEAAKIILDKYYNGQSIEDFKSEIEYTPDYSDPKVIDELADKKATEKFNQKIINDTKDKFIKDLEMSNEELEKFEIEFEDRKNLKSFSIEKIQKHLESAYRDSNGNPEALKKVKKDQAIASVMWTWEGKGGKQKKDKPVTSLDKTRGEVRELFWKYWINKK